jgi:hypothetical protein
MAIDLHLLINTKNKWVKQTGQLDEYFDSLLIDYTNASSDDLERVNDPWRWWLEVGQRRYSMLFKIALDYLSIPSTSCKCERAFSRAKQTITCDRNSFTSDTIEAIQFQQNWLQKQVVKSSLNDLSKHVRNVDKKQQAAAAGLAGDSTGGSPSGALASSPGQSEPMYVQ